MNTKKIIFGVLMMVVVTTFLAAVHPASAQVTELWSDLYDGGEDDLAWSVAVDSEDSVIVTGWSYDSATLYDYYTVKYDKNGIEQWSKTYDFRGDYDMAFDVAVDSEDNVIVTGASLNWTYDYCTVKYDKNGNELWSRRYDGGHPWPSADMAFEVAVDSEDNVIVTGWSHDGTHYNYYTIKYDKNGVEQWSKTYDGGLDDQPFELAIDSEDSVLVTGWSDNATTKYDYYTIKYNKNGVEEWNKRYDGSGFDDLAFYVATDSEDNVIVTGWSNNGAVYNYYTVKYNKNGVELWNKKYDSGSADLAWCVAVDSEDNVIVTGSSHDGASYNYYTVKYDKNGNELWNKKYDSGHDDRATGLAIDSNDNVIVTGQSYDGTRYNYYTIKYDKNGNEIWSKSYNGGRDDVNPAIAVDSENNVVVTGSSHGPTHFNYYTVEYGGPTSTSTPTPVPVPEFSIFGLLALIAVVTIVAVSRILKKI